ncbi:MAG: indolepyruvate ferredoxin oxidoreductase subunit alpha, partial [Candidatus Goldiibacteriota bacterium]
MAVEKRLLSGDEAIALGAWEAGAVCGFGYPGTPSTEILEAFAVLKGVYAEWSINEKVALEAATGASLGGARALVTMKHVGLNVALDAFVTLAYTGINSGLVVAVADDPGMHSSQNEQDSRYMGKLSYAPVIEPASPAEAREFIKKAYDLSEEFDLPVLFRITTRVAHSRGSVEFDMSITPEQHKKTLNVPWDKYVMMPLNAKKRRIVLVDKYEKLKKLAETTELNRIEMAQTDTGIITSGVAYEYVKEVFPEKSVLKLGLLNPLPEGKIREFASKVKKLYIVEELEPYIEEFVKSLGIACVGKEKVPLIDELSPDVLREAFFGAREKKKKSEVTPPGRPPQLCEGCSYRVVFDSLRRLKCIVAGDIGCYTLGSLPPFEAIDSCVCMGASIGVGLGLRHVLP